MTRLEPGPDPPARGPSSAVAIVGPTASGKTAVAHALAERTGLPILSADAMLVYRGMNIGTAKPGPEEIRRYSYLGLDLANPDRSFSVGAYLQAVAEPLRGRPEPPRIVCGGSGLYIACLFRGVPPHPSNPEIRHEAERRLEKHGIPALQRWLRESAPDRFAALADPLNPRRLIRALEMAHAKPARAPAENPPAPIRVFGLAVPPETLRRRIARRIRRMLREGWPEEARALRERYGTLSPTAAAAIGYREIFAMLDGRGTEEEAAEAILLRTRRYAKRQMTWFRGQFDTCWTEAGDDRSVEAIAAGAEAFLRGNPPRPLAGLPFSPEPVP